MPIAAPDLPRELARQTHLSPLWFITGKEPLLMIESADHIRARARQLGFSERVVIDQGTTQNWGALVEAASNVGLFIDKQLIEVRVPSGKIAREGQKIVTDYVQNPYPDVVTIFSIAQNDRDWQISKSAWWQALQKHCTVVDCSEITRAALPKWLAMRMAQNKQSTSNEALEAFADLVEGNLLAAKQEIAKLALLFPEGILSIDDILKTVTDSSRYGVGALIQNVELGHLDRIDRIVDALAAQNEPLPEILGLFAQEIRKIIMLRTGLEQGKSYVKGVYTTQELRTAANRLSLDKLQTSLIYLGNIERIFKGLILPTRNSDPWLELKSLCQFLATR